MTEKYEAETPGQLLRAARLARGSDLMAAHEGTKISLRLLEALERDEYHQVSDQLYVKSFLRNYAGWLGLDTATVLRLYERFAGDPAAAQRPGEPVWSEHQVTVRRIGVPWLRYATWALAALILLVLIWLLWPRPDQTPPPAQEVPVVPADTLPETTSGPASLSPSGAARAGAVAPAAQPLAAPAPDLPAAVRGDPQLRFAGGERFALVLRIRLAAGANCAVRRDGQPAAMPLIWPEETTPLPAANLQSGLAYAARGGHVAYWGANDHFVVTLGDLQGVEVTLNGVLQPVQQWRPGQPVVLDRFALGGDGGRP